MKSENAAHSGSKSWQGFFGIPSLVGMEVIKCNVKDGITMVPSFYYLLASIWNFLQTESYSLVGKN
jgi:hypothetical protein